MYLSECLNRATLSQVFFEAAKGRNTICIFIVVHHDDKKEIYIYVALFRRGEINFDLYRISLNCLYHRTNHFCVCPPPFFYGPNASDLPLFSLCDNTFSFSRTLDSGSVEFLFAAN